MSRHIYDPQFGWQPLRGSLRLPETREETATLSAVVLRHCLLDGPCIRVFSAYGTPERGKVCWQVHTPDERTQCILRSPPDYANQLFQRLQAWGSQDIQDYQPSEEVLDGEAFDIMAQVPGEALLSIHLFCPDMADGRTRRFAKRVEKLLQQPPDKLVRADWKRAFKHGLRVSLAIPPDPTLFTDEPANSDLATPGQGLG